MKVSRLRAYFSIAVVLASLIAALSGCGAAEAVTLNNSSASSDEGHTGVNNNVTVESMEEVEKTVTDFDMAGYIYDYMRESGYRTVDYNTWNETVGWPLAELSNIPDCFEKLPCIFLKNNPGIPDHLMVSQVWYDEQDDNLIKITQDDLLSENEEWFSYADKSLSGEIISEVFPFANRVVIYHNGDTDGYSVHVWMLTDDSMSEAECEKMLSSVTVG